MTKDSAAFPVTVPEPDTIPDIRVEAHCLWSGQRRAYADTEREWLLIFASWWESTTGKRRRTGYEPEPARVKEIARSLIGLSWKEEGEPRHGLEPYLDAFGKVAPGVWHIKVVEPYCD